MICFSCSLCGTALIELLIEIFCCRHVAFPGNVVLLYELLQLFVMWHTLIVIYYREFLVGETLPSFGTGFPIGAVVVPPLAGLKGIVSPR